MKRTVRAIFTAYLGWLDGSPTNLHSLPPKERVEKTVVLAGGTDAVLWAAEEGVGKGSINGIWRYMVLLVIGVNSKDARRQKNVVLTKLAAYKTSINERYYYWACAHELETVIREGFVRVQG